MTASESTDTTDGATTAVSLFGGDGAENEFPVLKAFQQYIDAEQAKARRRMLGLSVFFIALLVVVIVTFTFVMVSLLDRGQAQQNELLAKNQALQDRMLEIALRERAAALPPAPVSTPAPVGVSAPAAESAELKAVRESVAALAAAVAADREAARARSAEDDAVIRAREAAEKIRSEREELRRQRELLKAEKEKARLEEVERQRRRLYPEYYAKQDAERASSTAVPSTSPVTVMPKISAPVDYFSAYGDGGTEEPVVAPSVTKKKARVPARAAKPVKKKSESAVPPIAPVTVKTETLEAGGIPIVIGDLSE